MNKIYKVIWSKVKNQYVVVSELAHSNGKQSRTSRNSIRSRIAALVVCGAIAAFGVFSAVPNSAYAVAGGVATQSQYIAIATDSNSDDTANYDGYNYYKKSVSINGQTKYYYVREGYDISVVYGKRYAGADNSSAYIIDAKKNDQYNQSSDQGLLQAYQTTTSKGQITTLTGVNIEDLNTGVYGGASNAGGVDTPSDFGYHIKVNNLDGVFTVDDDGYIKVSNDLDGRGDWTIDAGVPGNTNFETYFSDKVTLENDGTYSYTHGNEKVTVPTNKVYSIGGKLGVFTDAKGNLYTGDVYGDNNEILLSAVGEGNQIYSYWGTKVNDPTQTIGNMTVQDYNSDRKKLQDQAAAYHGDDITNIAVGGANNKGTISLNRVGIYDEQTGGYTSTTPVPGTITVTSTGGTGGSGVEHDVKIKFSNTDEQGTEHSFTVDAGSKVVANNGAGGTDLETISVNGQTFNVIGGAISGQIDSKGNVKIQQGNKAPVTIGKVSDWNVKSGQINGSTLTLTTENAYDGDPKTKTVTIEGVASTNYVDGKDALNVKYDSTDKTSITLGKDGNKTQIHNVAAGTDDYDAVNFKQLQDVAGAEDYVKEGTINTSTGVIKLTRQLGGEITINGLQDYVNGKDSYVTDAKLNGNTLTITQNNQGKPFNIDLSGLTSGLSSSDYQLVAPESGSYTVDNNGNLTLTVKDLNNKNAATKTITISGLAKKTDVAVIHDQYKDGEYTNLRDTKAQIWDETAGASDKKSSSIALGKDAFVSIQNGNKANAVLFDSDTYTGGIAIGQDSKALNGTVNIGVKDYTGKMGDVIVGDPNNRDLDNGEYNTYTAMGVGETSVGSNSYISGSLSTNIGSYNVITTKYGDYEKTGNGFMDAILAGLNKPYAAQNTGSIVVGTLNSIESNSSTDVTSGVANSVVGMANKTQNSNGSLVFGTGNEITNSIDSIPSPVELSDIISGKKNDKDVTEVANSFRDSVSDRDNKNGGAVLAIGGGNKADYALNSQLIGVQNQITGTKDAASQYNMVNGYQNTVENGSNDTVIGVKNTVTNGDSNIVLGDNHTVQNADNNVILGSSDKVATQTASDTVVIGHNAQANGNNDVAIGSGSIANGAVGTEGYAGANPIGTVSVGSEGNERTITNVAAGRINEDSTDAVNGSQLASVKDGAVKYWQNEDGSYDNSFVQLEGGEDGTLVTHVRDGAVNEYSSDAVNGSQLYAVQQEAGKHTTVTVNGGVEAPEDGSYTNKDGHLDGNLLLKQTNNDGQIQYDIKLNPDVNLTGEGKDSDNRVWLSGSNGTITATTKNNLPEKTTVINGGNVYVGTSVSVGANDDVVITDKDITGLSNTTWDGTTDDESRAATEGQLQTVSKDVASLNDGAVKYWQNEDGSYDKSFVQLEGGEDGTLVTHVRDGAVNEYSSDAVNGSQLWETQQQIEEAQTEAGKHTTIQETGKNINVTKTETDGQLDYTINLNDDITLGNYTKGTGVVVSGSSGTISATNAISVGVDPNNEQKGIVISSGKSDSIVGLDNIEWKNDADWQKDNIQADRAATEGQLQQATSTLTTNERHIATNGGDNPEAPNNKYTVQANGTVSLTEVNGDGTPTKNTVVLDNVATKTQQDINTDKLTHIEHYAVDDEGNTEGKDYTQVEGTKLYNDGSISSTVKDGWGMSSDTLTFDESGLTVSKETMGNGSGSTNISGDTIKTVDEYGNETTIDGGSVTTEDLTVNTENGNKLTFDSTGLNVNSGDTGLSVNKDGISLSVDNGAGKNSSVKVTQDGTEFSYSENGIADATTTTIKGSTITTDTVTGLNNTTWDDELAKQVANSEELQGTAATQGQLQQAVSEVAEVANAGWTASDGTNSISVKPNETLTFVGNENLTVSADGTDKELKVSLNDDITLGDGENAIKIDGTNGTLNIGNTFAVAEDGTVLSDGDVIADADGEKYSLSEVGKYAVRYDKTNDGTSTITLVDGDDLSGTRIKNVADGVDPKDAVNVSQLEAVEATANAGWTASDGTNSISVKPNETLTFVGDENLTVSADGTDKKLKVSLNDNITLGDGQSAITLNGSPQNSDDPALSVGTDKFVVAQDGSLSVSDKFNVDAETGNIYAANNSGSAIMMNDDSVALNAGGNGIVASDEGILLNTNGIDEDIKLVTKGTSVSVDNDGATFTNTNTNETTNIDGGTINVGDRLMVEEDGSIYATNNNGSTVMINDNGVALNSEGNGVVVSGEGITLNTNGSAVTVDRFNGATFTNTNTGETTNINGDIITTDTVKGLSNTTWDDELATQVANSEELQGTAATQGQLQQAVSAVATEAAKQHTTVSGDDNLTVKSSVNENGGTNYQVTLDDDITLGNPKAGNTEGERSFTINTTAPEGYVPDSYKEENSSGAEFIKENGGFMLFATDTQGHGIFGVTAKGSAWAKDFKTYTTDIYGNNTQYSLNDVGDAVAQMSSYYNKENGKSYTVFSRYLNEAEKDNPFATVDENATRDIPLALRDDGAVLIGATIKGDDFTDNGIRINAETETTYDGDGNEVTNNIATITGLENTEWKPPTPVATLAANDGSATVTSRAATESQLNDLYSAVAAYDVNVDGTIDYSHIALAGAPYGASRAGNGTPTGGTSITNVAYASGKDGSEAVNVDYLNDAISDAAENGSISTSDQHLVANTETGSNGVYKPNDDGNVNLIVSDEKGNSSTITIGDVASKEDLDNLKDDVGDLDYSKVEGDTIIDGDSVTDAIGKLDNKIENISGTATDADNNTVTGGKINSDGTISLTQKDKDSIKLEGQLTDSGVVQEGTSFDKETGTITITSQDKYSGETSSVKVEGIASTEVVGATNKEDLATAYKDADKDGNATTEYITDSESMVEADVALDHAIQDVANTSYANDMVLSNRIDSVEKRLGNVEERIDKVGAMAAAIANLRTMGFDPEAPTEIAIGVGQYKSETGIAIGVFHYPNQDFMLSASLSSSGDELMGGIGATWKLGRKSAAERAKDEEARHLEQAEEMKKLAQQEKVKAQAQRHAKLLAERQQASQKNA